MKKLATLAAAVLAVATFGSVAIAQDSSTDKFATADGNKDSAVTWEEAVAAFPTLTEDLFKKADANADGKLDATEFASLEGLGAVLDTASSSSAAQ